MLDTYFGFDLENIRQRISEIYDDRLSRANKGRGFHNCAGFVKYLLGLSQKDGFVNPNDSSSKGLLFYLDQIFELELTNFNEKDWVTMAKQSDAVALLHNDSGKWQYLHFFVPSPKLSMPFEVYQRGDFEEEYANIEDIREIIGDNAYSGDTR